MALAEASRPFPLFGILTAAFLTLAVFAVVFTNQPDPSLTMFGRALHLASILCGITLLVRANAGGWVYVAVVAGLFAIGLAGYRLPYEVGLSVLFLAVGAVLAAQSRQSATTVVLAITIVSGLMMLLQALGVGEWTQTLTTHGIVADGPDATKEPNPSLFVGYYDLHANYLQGRPAGLLHSNQFASLIVLFALALRVGERADRHWLFDAALCVTAVLTLAKVVFLGMGLLLAFQYLRGSRAIAIRFALFTGAALVAYAVFFPGMFLTYFLSLHNIWQSVAIRIADTLALLGSNTEEIKGTLLSVDFGLRKDGQITDGLLERLAGASEGGRVSAFTALAPYAAVLYALTAVALIGACMNAAARNATVHWMRTNVGQEHVSVLIALGTFCLAANFLGAQIFWLMAGFAVPGATLLPGSTIPNLADRPD